MYSNSSINNRKLLFLPIFILIIITIMPVVLADIDINAYSYSTDFYAQAPQQIDVCACGSTTGTILIKNTGTYTSRFYLESDNELLVLPGNQYEIKPNQEYSIPFTISTDCDFTDDKITLIISNSFNKYKEFDIDVQGLKCQNLASVLTYDKDLVSPCEPIHFELQVENIGNFAETYYYDFGKFDKYIKYDYKTVKLPAGQLGNFNVELTLPCEMTGNYSIPTNVYTLGSEYSVGFITDITVKKDYDFKLDFLDELFVCTEDDSTLYLTITNNNNFTNTFYIKNLYPDFVSLENNKFAVEANQIIKVPFIISGSEKYVGDHNISFEVISMYGDITKILNSNLHMANCYDLSLNIDSDKIYSCRSDLNNIELTIKNNAEISQNISLELPYLTSIFSLNETEFELASHEEKKIIIDVSNVPYEDGLYNLVIDSYISGKDVKYSKELSIDITSNYNCERAVLIPSSLKINYDEINNSFFVKNIGSKTLNYNITITPHNNSRSSWINIIENKVVSLEPGQQQEFIISFNKTIVTQEQGDYYFDINIKSLDSGIEYNEELKIKLRDKSCLYYAGIWIINNPILVIIIIVVLLLIALLLYLFISRPKNLDNQNKRKKRAKKIFLAWLILAIIALILLFIFCPFKLLYPNLDTNTNDFNITMYSNDYYQMDLSNYFSDPDNDILNYYAEVKTIGNNTLEGYQISFNNSFTIIHPFENVTGKLPIWFYASDSKEIVKSDMFLIEVVEKPAYTFMDIVNYYFCYIAWFVIVIFLLIFVLATLSWANRKTIRQHKNSKAKNKKKHYFHKYYKY